MLKNAQLYRNALCGIVAALALGGFQVAHAGYSSLPPPPGYTPGTSTARATYAAAATDKAVQNLIRQAGGATATVAGNKVKIDMAYKLAPTASRVAAAAIYLHPGVRTAVSIAAWLGTTAFVYNAAKGIWEKPTSEEVVFQTDLVFWTALDNVVNGVPSQYHSSAASACSKAVGLVGGFVTAVNDGACTYRKMINGKEHGPYQIDVRSKRLNCPPGTSPTAGGCKVVIVEYRPAAQEDFVEEVVKSPMPPTVPLELPPGTPLPVERPIVNPDQTNNPSGLPLRIPTGSPTPIPNTDPQQYRQPYVDIIPSPTVDDPLRVDIKPGETTGTDPNPAEQPNPDGEDKPAEEQEKSLCEKHPDILACQKPELDTPDGEIPRETKTVTYAEEGGFGGGYCPGNIYSNVGGKSIMVYNWSETCGVVSTYLRPIILLLGAMGALFILIPGRDS